MLLVRDQLNGTKACVSNKALNASNTEDLFKLG